MGDARSAASTTAGPAGGPASGSRRPLVVAVVSLVAATLFWAGNNILGAVAVSDLEPLALVFLR
ncbi:MAG: hypothetical protein Q7T71_20610, partial [Herbiconiux sp.]|nr:hypothetical protein [Herbiconiux sp.]